MGFVKLEPASGKVTGTHSNFPVYVDLSLIGVTTLAEAQSIRVYSDEAKTTELAREIVSVSECHIKIPSLTSSTDIWMDWDGVRADYAVTDTYGRNAVWSDYRAVWHMNDATASTFDDSTGGGFTANKRAVNEPQVITGKIGEAQDFDGTNDFANIAHSTTLSPTSNMSIQCWARSAAQVGHMVGKDNESGFRREGWILVTAASGSDVTYQFTAGLNSGYPAVTSTAQAANAWRMVHGTYTPSTELRIYINGASNNVFTTTIPASLAAVTRELNFGRRNNGFGPDRFYNGDLDEVRLRASTLSANWISTEYQNQNDNAAFWVATPVSGGAPDNGFMAWW
jgi:hypothetical protein